MSPEKAKQMLPIITAFAEGKPVEMKGLCTEKWEVSENLDFCYDADRYRIKPEPRERWVVEFRSIDGDVLLANVIADTHLQAENIGRAHFGARYVRAIRFVEAE